MRSTPIFDDLHTEFEGRGVDIESLLRQPPWNVKDAMAQAEAVIEAKRKRSPKRKPHNKG